MRQYVGGLCSLGSVLMPDNIDLFSKHIFGGYMMCIYIW